MYLWPFGQPHAQYTAQTADIYKYKFGKTAARKRKRESGEMRDGQINLMN